jgi:hypothetical protein
MSETLTIGAPSAEDVELTRKLLEAKRPSQEVAISGQHGGTPSSTFWGMHVFSGHGLNQIVFGLPNTVINTQSQIAVSMTELTSDGQPFLGLATMAVYNVVPTAEGNVLVKFDIMWDSPLTVLLNFIIVN